MRVVIRDFRADERAVASTVGTIMALLVFLTFLSVIVNQYVPTWMTDSEASHMNSALGQFGGVKGAVDLQMLAAQAAKDANSFQIPVTTATAVTLGVDGVPIFAGPTPGTLVLNPDAGKFNLTVAYVIPPNPTSCTGTGTRRWANDTSSGSLALSVANRYYTQQQLAYENGAVIRYQTDGQFIRVHPTFSVVSSNNTLDISFALVSLYGKGIVTGTTAEMVSTELFAFDRQDYSCFPSTNGFVWIEHTSPYGLAWYRFLNQTLSDSLKLGGTSIHTPLDESFTAKIGATSIYRVSYTYNPITQSYLVRLVVYNNPGVMTLGFFRLQHGQVQAGIGDATQQVF